MKTTEYCGLGDESVTLKCMIFVNGRILILTPVQSTHQCPKPGLLKNSGVGKFPNENESLIIEKRNESMVELFANILITLYTYIAMSTSRSSVNLTAWCLNQLKFYLTYTSILHPSIHSLLRTFSHSLIYSLIHYDQRLVCRKWFFR